MSNLQDCIAALATPLGESALAVIRTSGEGSIERLAACFSDAEKLRVAPGHALVYGWLRGAENQKVDEVTLGVFRSPRSYTGEDSVEIYCHGSMPGIKKIMGLLLSMVFGRADPGEFSLRAFINGKMDLTRAEAVQELIAAQTVHAQSLALNRLSGGIAEEIDRIKDGIVKVVAAVSVQLDYPEDELPGDEPDSSHLAAIPFRDLEAAISSLRQLSRSYQAGRLYQEGVRIALAGQSNAGKSSLFNLFLKEDRAIVSDIHGTTRDYLEAAIVLGGIPIKLFDTAGLREVDDFVEQEGIRRSEEIMQNSSIILYLVDGSRRPGTTSSGLAKIENQGIRCLKIWTKTDLPNTPAAPRNFLPLSTLTGEGFTDIQQALKKILTSGSGISPASESDLLIDSLRQKQLIDRALSGLEQAGRDVADTAPLDIIALSLQDALAALGEITGEVSSEDILERIFSQFCVGK